MKPLVLDNTICSSFRRCWQKGAYRHVEFLTQQKTPSALNFGQAFHAGVAAFYCGKSGDEALKIAISSWGNVEVANPDYPDWRTPQHLLELLETVFSHPIPKLLRSPSGEPVVEKDGAWPLTSKEETPELYERLNDLGYDELLYVILVDAAVEEFESIYVMDHKTTSFVRGERGEPAYIDSKFSQSFRPNSQIQGYCWGLSKFINRPVSGVIINGIGIHSKRILSANFTKKDYYCFQKFTVNYTPEEIEEWRRDTIQLALDYLRYKKLNIWRKSPEDCMSYGRACPYLPLCSVTPAVREGVKRLYTIEEWNPLEARKKEAAAIVES